MEKMWVESEAMADTTDYRKLQGETDDDISLAEQQVEDGPTPKSKSFEWRSIVIGTIVGFILSFLVFSTTSMRSRTDCIRKFSIWSPALDIFTDNELSLQRFQGALRGFNEFCGPPSQEIDDKWNEITFDGGSLVRLPQDQIERVNASQYAAEYTEEMGGGYIAGVEVFHQLHCVNMLRQATYVDYYLPKNVDWKDQETLRYHLDHCLDMLRQKLMCQPDVGMVTYVWAKGWKQPLPDFSTIHKCQDYSKVLDWAQDNYAHSSNVSDLERAPGALEQDTRP